MTTFIRGMRINQSQLNPLGALLGNELSWVTREALCAQTDPDLWFPEEGGRATAARKVCLTCPLLAACQDYALTYQPSMGVWAGLERDRTGRLLAPGEQPMIIEAKPRPRREGKAECGTTAAYAYHVNHGEPTCQPCRDANSLASLERKQRKQAAEDARRERAQRARRGETAA